jgi:hypothetical protein
LYCLLLSFGHCIVCYFLWSLYYFSFLLVILLFVLSFGHCFVCSFFFWLLYCCLEHSVTNVISLEVFVKRTTAL